MSVNKRKKKLGNLNFSTVNIDLTIDILDQIMLYVMIDPDTNPYITRKSLSNISELFSLVDKRLYETDEIMISRISFIQKILHYELKENIYTYELLISKVLEGTHKEEIQNSIIPFIEGTDPLTMDEVKFINKYVSERIKYAYLFKYREILNDQFEDLMLNRFDSITEINSELEETLTSFANDIRRTKMDDENNKSLDFSDNSFDDNALELIDELKQPTNYLKTGIINLNKMLSGGFESGRVYLFMGITGGFKSGILLNILYWIKKYNLKYQTKDPNKIPTILYITQENSLKETLERLWNVGCSEKDIRTVSNKKILKMFKNGMNFGLSEESNINIRIEYRANKTISTDDLYNIYDDLEDDGKEVICVIHDYTKRIRAANPTGDLRIDLGNIVDEETVFAKSKNIPFITAAQLNRKAMETIEEAAQKGRKNAIEKLGASNVGESWAMLENADWVGLLNIDEIPNEVEGIEPKKFISIKQLKIRGKKPSVFNSFTQPFVEGNGMRILDDEETGKSASIQSLETFNTNSMGNVEGFSSTLKKKNKTTIDRRAAKKKKEIVTDEVLDDLSDEFN